jgi:HEAT repeat protein
MNQNVAERLTKRASRASAIIEICQQGLTGHLSAVVHALDQLTWAEVQDVAPYLPLLGPPAVPALCRLLKSERKQTAEIITGALAAIGDVRAAEPLVQMMEEQADRRTQFGHATR